ncbi:MAG: SfiI family type II restriction endonuclease [bacterium]|nr:SfiI family type II restriction endonuclease [bacterium]
MTHIINPAELDLDEIEEIEKQCLRSLFQAAVDFRADPYAIFKLSTDEAENVAEDITREFMDRLGCYQIFQQRILGKVDYRKARYIVLPNLAVRQALFLDSKAIKSSTDARLEMTQLSLRVLYDNRGVIIDQPGHLPTIYNHDGLDYLVTTQLAHYDYRDNAEGKHILQGLTLAAIPSGLLQERYNPNAQENIWKASPHSTKLQERGRIRLSFAKLKALAGWRVQSIRYVDDGASISHEWSEG